MAGKAVGGGPSACALIPLWGNWRKRLALDLSTTAAAIWGVNQQMQLFSNKCLKNKTPPFHVPALRPYQQRPLRPQDVSSTECFLSIFPQRKLLGCFRGHSSPFTGSLLCIWQPETEPRKVCHHLLGNRLKSTSTETMCKTGLTHSYLVRTWKCSEMDAKTEH